MEQRAISMYFANKDNSGRKAASVLRVAFLLVSVFLLHQRMIVHAEEKTKAELYITVEETKAYPSKDEQKEYIAILPSETEIFITNIEDGWCAAFYNGRTVYLKQNKIVPYNSFNEEKWEEQWEEANVIEEYREEFAEYVQQETRGTNKKVVVVSAVLLTVIMVGGGTVWEKKKRTDKKGTDR